ncbi:RidA family protein (plasmid) [Pseudomonas silvicola]|nr:RidA family protein [Pseudomonas silvicola]
MSIINPAGLKARSYYNHAKIRPGTPVFPTGQVAWDEEGTWSALGICRQACWVRYAHRSPGGLGHSDRDCAHHHYVTDLALVPHIHPVRQRFFEGLELPASTLFQILCARRTELLLEIDVVIMLP